MSQKVFRSFKESTRGELSFEDRWRGQDEGLITSYEVGKDLRSKEPELVKKVMDGELPLLGWKGGVKKKVKINEKYGSLHYLAQWQALKGLDLDIDPNEEVSKICSRTGMKVTYTASISKLSDEQGELNFTAIDFETATGKRSSICQVGIVKVEEGEIIKKFSRLVKPPNNDYLEWNTRIHGITPNDTTNSPTFPEIWDEIKPYIQNNLVVAHNSDFDVDCLHKTLDYYNIPRPSFEVDCTYKRTDYKLDEICEAFNIQLDNHHDAECDAKACADVYIKLINNVQPDYSKISKKQTNFFQQKGHERLIGDILKPDLENSNPSSPFYGKKVVFTGVLKLIKRQTAAEIVKRLGADIDTGITKRTKFVITGSAPGPSKLKKIEKFNLEGSEIKIIFEDEFLEMIKSEL